MFTELYRDEKREDGDRGGQEDKRGESKGERQIQPVISSLSVLHHLRTTSHCIPDITPTVYDITPTVYDITSTIHVISQPLYL